MRFSVIISRILFLIFYFVFLSQVIAMEQIPNHRKMSIEGMGIDVGLLREQWTLPSDHLPIGIRIITFNNKILNIASWNVLNTEYIKYAIADHSGLNNSTLTIENTIIESDGLTQREQHVIDLILNGLLALNEHFRDIIALQECGQAFVSHLRKNLPQHIALITAAEHESDQSVMLYNTERFDCRSIDIKAGIFTDRPKRTIMNVLFEDKESKTLYRCLTAHLPWIPNGPAATQLASYVKEQTKSINNETIILMGDMNKTELAIAQSFNDVGISNFQQFSPYSTFIPFFLDGTYTRSACFDHIFIFSNVPVRAQANSPDEVLDGLSILAHKLGFESKHGINNKGILSSSPEFERIWIESALPFLAIDTNTYIQNSVPNPGLPSGRSYKEDRKQLHQAIKREIIGNSLPVSPDRKPNVVLFMGLPGAGKSTLIKNYKAKIETKTGYKPVVLGLDLIVEKIPEYQKSLIIKKLGDNKVLSARDSWEIAHIEANHVKKELFDDVIQEKMNLIFEGMGISDFYEKVINGDTKVLGLKDAGYKVKIIFMDVPVELACERVEKRTKVNGRVIAEGIITKSNEKLVKRNFMQHAINPKVSSAIIINNENLPVVCCKIKKNQHNQLSIIDDNKYMRERGFYDNNL
jgi:predicted kinase/endonuclease/exonuclease/phosphatase family metal-dependent hydrolase